MFLNPSLSSALDRIAERAADARRAYTPGALPQHDDVATPASLSYFTLDPLAVVAPDGAYFVVKGEGERAYTRDGSFALVGGRLVDAGGRAIYGVRAGSGGLDELCVDPIDEALGRVRDAGIEPDGSFVYRREAIDPRNGARELQRVVVGRVALARFPAGTRLESGNGSLVVVPTGVAGQTGLAEDGTFGPLTPMRRERSRVDIDESLVRLKDAYLAFDALQAAEVAKAHLGKTAMDLLK